MNEERVRAWNMGWPSDKAALFSQGLEQMSFGPKQSDLPTAASIDTVRAVCTEVEFARRYNVTDFRWS